MTKSALREPPSGSELAVDTIAEIREAKNDPEAWAKRSKRAKMARKA